MSKSVYTVGVGFPARLKSLLSAKNLRPSEIERRGGPKMDALGRWSRGECVPERQSFLNFAKIAGLGSAEAINLLRQQGEPVLVPLSGVGKHLLRFYDQCDTVEASLDQLDGDEAVKLARRLRSLARLTEERARAWTDSTTTRKEVASSS